MSISRQSCQEQTSGLLLQFLTRIYFPKSWPPCFDFGSVDFNGNTNKDSFSSITVNVEGSQEVHRESWHPSPDRLVQKNSQNLGSKGKGQSHTWRLAPWFLMTCSLHCAYLLFLLVFKSFTILQPKNMTAKQQNISSNSPFRHPFSCLLLAQTSNYVSMITSSSSTWKSQLVWPLHSTLC